MQQISYAKTVYGQDEINAVLDCLNESTQMGKNSRLFEEKIAKQDLEKSRWADLDPPGPASWAFNPTTCVYEAPVPYPEDGLDYFWDEDKKEWIRMTAQC